MPQTAYDIPAAAFAGMIADITFKDVRSGINEESTAMPWGIAVVQGTTATNKDYIKLPTAADDQFIGILVHDHAHDNRASAAGADEDLPADNIGNVMRWGYCYCVPEVAVTKGDQVFVRIDDGVADATETQKGSLTNIDDSGTAVAIPGLRWAESGAKDVATLVEVKLPPRPGERSAYSVDHVEVTADTTQFFFESHKDRFFVVEDVIYYNATGLAQDATNFFDIQVKHGSTIVANWSTETGEEGSIAADTPVRPTLGADLVIPPDTRVNIVLDESGTATLPAGTLQVIGRYL